MYWFSTYETVASFVSMRLGDTNELGRCLVVEGLMEPDVVIGPFPFHEGFAHGGDRGVCIDEFMEFLRVGALGAFDVSVESWRPGRKHEKADAAPAVALSRRRDFRFGDGLVE